MRKYFNLVVGLLLLAPAGLYVYALFTSKLTLDIVFPIIFLGVSLLLLLIAGVILLKNFFCKTSNATEDKGALYLFFGLLAFAFCYFVAVKIDNNHDAGSGFLTFGIFAVSFVLLLVGAWKVISSSMFSSKNRS